MFVVVPMISRVRHQTRPIVLFQCMIRLFCVNSINGGRKGTTFSRYSPRGGLGTPGPRPQVPAPSEFSAGVREPENGGHRGSLQRWSVARGPAPSRALPPRIPALRPAHLRSASGPGVAGAPHQPTGLREPSWGHLVLGPREAQAPVMDQEGIEVTVGISRLTPSQSCGVSSTLHPLRPPPEPPPGGGAQSSVCVESFPAGWTPSHLAEKLLRFVLGKLKHQLTLLASLERTGVTQKVVHFDARSRKSGNTGLRFCIPPLPEATHLGGAADRAPT